MGEVLRARDARLDRDVAIKVLPAGAAGDPERLRRFIAEAKTVSALNHPNILTLHEIGESASGPYLVTEVVEGETLRARLARGPLPVDAALDVAAQTADGLAKAHEAGIVHRDVKPENLMITRDGFVKILDFGLAKLRPTGDSTFTSIDAGLTATGVIVGTPAYLSPEQLHGLPADSRSDLFALGVVLDEMLAGANAYRRESAAGTMSAILRDDPAPLETRRPGIPLEVAELSRRLLEKDPARRPSSAREVASRLRELRTLLSSGAASSPAAPAPRPRRALAPAALLGAAVLAGAAAILVFARAAPDAPPIPTPPRPETAPLAAAPQDPTLAPPADRLGVAVLPLRDDSGDPQLAEAAIGRILTDAFVQILSDVPAFYVTSPLRLDGVARSLGRPFDDAATDLEFARELCEGANAKAMLTGSVARVGSTYVMQATLTDLETERLLDTFRSESKSADDLLDSVTKSVGEELAKKYSSAEEAREAIGPPATHSIEAYAHFVRASEWTIEGKWDEAIVELNAAVAVDPEMALAWSELGCAYSFAGDEARSLAAARRAVALIERVNRKERRWIELNALWVEGASGQRYFEEAKRYIAEFPDDRQGYFYAGLGLEYLTGDCKTALEYYEKSFALTPNYFPITKGIVDCLLKLDRRGDAEAVLERYLAIPRAGEHGRRLAGWRLEEIRKGA